MSRPGLGSESGRERVPGVVSRTAPRGPAPPRGRAFEDLPPGRRWPSIRPAWRALRRHWWQALLLWSAGSAGLMALARDRLGPVFEASSAIGIDPVDRGPSAEGGALAFFASFKETQARRVTNPDVLASALSAHPGLLGGRRPARSADPEAELRRAVTAAVIPGTNLIRVAATAGSAEAAAAIVDAVTDAYLARLGDAPEFSEEDGRLRRRLREAREERLAAVRGGREAVAGLVERVGSVDADRARARDSVAIEAYRVVSRQVLQLDLELVEEQARLGQIPDDPPATEAPAAAASPDRPEAAEVRARLIKARERLAQAGRIARNPGDPAWVDARKAVDDLQARLEALRGRPRPATPPTPPADRAAERHASEARIEGLKARLAQLAERLGQINARVRSAGSDELALEFARQDLARAESVLDGVTRSLDRADFESRGPVARFRREYRAVVPTEPLVDRRGPAMAAVPLGMFLVVLGLFTAIELRAGRVADPEDVPARLRLGVLGVVPPLPRTRPGPGPRSRREEIRSGRDLDRFLRSLDHLRATLCPGRDLEGPARRSILITSATGGEGKTTLAAQLAGRCIHAGLFTLLIDADLRNPALSRMLDRPEGRGLVDVLRGEATAEEAIAVIGEGGGFHFLPAGSGRDDPAGLLQGGRLAGLLARARESFDLVIVDAPPVLPVPDALTIGRWVDGAVLAVRFDASRYPMVERANRRLAAAGVPVLGAVINGFRGAGPDDPPYGPPGAGPTTRDV